MWDTKHFTCIPLFIFLLLLPLFTFAPNKHVSLPSLPSFLFPQYTELIPASGSLHFPSPWEISRSLHWMADTSSYSDSSEMSLPQSKSAPPVGIAPSPFYFLLKPFLILKFAFIAPLLIVWQPPSSPAKNEGLGGCILYLPFFIAASPIRRVMAGT